MIFAGNHEYTAEHIFDVLELISKETNYGFIVEYTFCDDYYDGMLFLQFGEVFFHGEVILNGNRCLNDFEDRKFYTNMLDSLLSEEAMKKILEKI